MTYLKALAPPLAVRLYEDGTEAAVQRLLLLALAVISAWAALFARVVSGMFRTLRLG